MVVVVVGVAEALELLLAPEGGRRRLFELRGVAFTTLVVSILILSGGGRMKFPDRALVVVTGGTLRPSSGMGSADIEEPRSDDARSTCRSK